MKIFLKLGQLLKIMLKWEGSLMIKYPTQPPLVKGRSNILSPLIRGSWRGLFKAKLSKNLIVSKNLLFMSFLLIVLTMPVRAHHILGIPHYSYNEDYPQTPVLTYRVEMGSHEVKMTSFPGKPRPGESCNFHVYIKHLSSGELFQDSVTLTVLLDRMIGEDSVVYGPIQAKLEEAIFKFYPLFKEEANYITRIEYFADGEPMIIDLPIVVGEPGSPWKVLAGVGAGVILFLVGIRATRIKLQRKRKKINTGNAEVLPEV